MSKNNKRHRKEKQKLKLRRQREIRSPVPQEPLWQVACSRASMSMRRGLWDEARQTLEEYDQAHPGNPEVSGLLLDVYHELQEYPLYCRICRRMIEREPQNRSLPLMLAGANLANANLATAYLGFQCFVRLYPHDPMSEDARGALADLQPAIDELLASMPAAWDDRLECAALNEEIGTCLAAGECQQAIQAGEQLLARHAEFPRAMNNLSEAYFRTGQAEWAIAMSRGVLRQQPENVHALANLTRHLFLSGDQQAAEAIAGQLLSAHADNDELWCKKCEALSFLGNDEAVRAVYAEADQSSTGHQPSPIAALLHHLGAAAFARLGDARRAERYWRKALKIVPEFHLAKTSLEDAAQPIGQRHGPWYFPLHYWFGGNVIAEMRGSFAKAKTDEEITRAGRRFVETHPEIVRLIPALLDRGDRSGREFAVRLAKILETADTNDALRTFCLSQRGPDAMRIEAANWLCQKGVIPSGRLQIWFDGRQTEIELLGFQVTSEPSETCHSPAVEALACEGIAALHADQGKKAAELFQRCIDLDGESPALLNNLAAAYGMQGREEESLQLIRRVHERWPDYFFGRTAMANIATGAGNYDLSESYLAPLRRTSRLHITEFTALATANINLLLAQGKKDAARHWVKLWREIDPDNRNLQALELRCEFTKGAIDRFRKLWSGSDRVR